MTLQSAALRISAAEHFQHEGAGRVVVITLVVTMSEGGNAREDWIDIRVAPIAAPQATATQAEEVVR